MNTINSLRSASRAGYCQPSTVRAYVSTLAALSATIRSEGATTLSDLAALPAFSHLGRATLAAMVSSLISAGCVEREGSQWLLWVNPTVASPDADTSADSSAIASQSFMAVA